MEKLTDLSPLPAKGRYHGVAMANVPADELIHLACLYAADERIVAYVNENRDVLEKEIEQIKKYEFTTSDDDDA